MCVRALEAMVAGMTGLGFGREPWGGFDALTAAGRVSTLQVPQRLDGEQNCLETSKSYYLSSMSL